MTNDKVVRDALQSVLHPKLGKSLLDVGMIRDISIKEGVVTVTLAWKSATSPLRKLFSAEIEKVVGALPEVTSVQVVVKVLSPEDIRSPRMMIYIPGKNACPLK